MIFRKLGEVGFPVSVVSFGGWQLGDSRYWGDDPEADEDHVVGTAMDAGINFFDTAEMYGDGEAERALGKVLKGRRDHVYVASKLSPENCAPGRVRAACEASLMRLGMDAIDLYQVHWPVRDVPFCDTYGALEQLRDEGKIRAIGVSNFGSRDLGAWLNCGACCSNQIGYNLLFRAPEVDILPACRNAKIGVLTYMPLMQGVLSGRYHRVEDIPEKRRRTRHFAAHRPGTRHGEAGCEDAMMRAVEELRALSHDLEEDMATLALAWVLAQPAVTSVIVGARKSRQLRQNLRATEISLDPAIVARMSAITEPVKTCLGSNADMWDAGDAARIH